MSTSPPTHGRTTPALQQNSQPEPQPEPEPESTRPDQEVVLEGEELFMVISSEEEEEWRKKMEEMETHLQARKDNFDQWHDGITRRRMFAYSRLRKLQEAGKQRGVFLDEISAYLASAKPKSKVNKDRDNKLKSQKTNESKDTVSSDAPRKQQQQQQQEETAVDSDTVTVKPLLRNSD